MSSLFSEWIFEKPIGLDVQEICKYSLFSLRKENVQCETHSLVSRSSSAWRSSSSRSRASRSPIWILCIPRSSALRSWVSSSRSWASRSRVSRSSASRSKASRSRVLTYDLVELWRSFPWESFTSWIMIFRNIKFL